MPNLPNDSLWDAQKNRNVNITQSKIFNITYIFYIHILYAFFIYIFYKHILYTYFIYIFSFANLKKSWRATGTLLADNVTETTLLYLIHPRRRIRQEEVGFHFGSISIQVFASTRRSSRRSHFRFLLVRSGKKKKLLNSTCGTICVKGIVAFINNDIRWVIFFSLLWLCPNHFSWQI